MKKIILEDALMQYGLRESGDRLSDEKEALIHFESTGVEVFIRYRDPEYLRGIGLALEKAADQLDDLQQGIISLDDHETYDIEDWSDPGFLGQFDDDFDASLRDILDHPNEENT